MGLQNWQIEFFKTIERHRKQGFGWRYDGLESWTDEAIFSKLRELKVDTDAERFAQQARAAGRIKVLDDDWNRQITENNNDPGLWQDFPLLALPLLWERLAADVSCPEVIEQRLYKVLGAEDNGLPLAEVGGVPALVVAALEFAKYLQGFGVSERAARFEDVKSIGYYDYDEWLLDLVERYGPTYPDEITRIADVMSDCTSADRYQSELALALAAGGRREEAVRRAIANIARFPGDVWVKILAGDVYRELGEDAQAISIWLDALSSAKDNDEWGAAAERIEEVFLRTGRADELEGILGPYPMPEEEIIESSPVVEEPLPPERPPLLIRAKLIGRNEPCPCGSGKKYKKCCMP